MLAAKLQTEALSRRIDFIPATSSHTGAYDIPRLVTSMKKEGVPVFVLGKKTVKATGPLVNGKAVLDANGLDENEKKVNQCCRDILGSEGVLLGEATDVDLRTI